MELRFLMLIWVIILMKILLARENNIKQNENKNKMLNRLSFLSENDDPQKYMGYDREGSDNRHKRDKCHHKAAQYKEYQE